MDSVTAASNAMARDLASSAMKRAHCDKCDSIDVVWMQSKTGKWYLNDAYYSSGGMRPMRGKPHFKSCTANQPKREDMQ